MRRNKRQKKIKSESAKSVRVVKGNKKPEKEKQVQKKKSKKKEPATYTLYCYTKQRFRFYLPLETTADEGKLPKEIRKFIKSKKDELDLRYGNKITTVYVKEIDMKVRI